MPSDRRKRKLSAILSADVNGLSGRRAVVSQKPGIFIDKGVWREIG